MRPQVVSCAGLVVPKMQAGRNRVSNGPRAVIVTGAESGIGANVAREVLECDVETACGLIDVSTAGGEDFRRSFGERVIFEQCDVTNQRAVQAAVGRIAAALGPITGLVNAAGIHSAIPSIDLGQSDWNRMLAVHLSGTFFAAQAVARTMIEASHGGAIVNLASVAMDFGWPERLSYAVAKAGVGALTRTLAVEWAPLGIRVNAVAPGYIDTPMVRNAALLGTFDIDERRSQHALQRFGTVEEVSAVIRFLLSPAASFVTGEVVKVDGGFSVKK